MTDASGSTVYEYTAKAQIKKETKTIDSVQYVTQYSYDQNGNLKTITEPSGEVITYNYSNDKAVSVLDNAVNLATSINYKPLGGISSLTYGNGIAGSIGYDNQYRITGITVGSAMNLSYPTYDANGNIMAINNALDPTKNKSFGYDALDRLTSAAASGLWGSLAWTYDGVGNRLTENSNSYAYTTGTNKLIGAGGASFGYDNNGNTTSQAARQYTYNQNQRLVQVVDGAMTAIYTYNGNGQRVKKVVNGTTTVFHYDQRGQLIAESNGSGAITAVYVYLNGQPLAKIEGTSVYYYHNDALGTPQKMTDASGTVVWAADYKPFGEATITVSTITNNFRFPGQYYDAETGNYYNYMRDYNPVIGRYIEADPIGIQSGLNHLYVYAGNNSIRFMDLSGTWSASGGAYAGGGADFTIANESCCSGGKKRKVTYLMSCVGFGVGGKLFGAESPVSVAGKTVGITSYGNTCPKTGDLFLSKSVTTGPCSQSAQYGNRGAGAEAGCGLGWGVEAVPIKACAIIVFTDSADGSCPCKEEGKRWGNTAFQ
jgi:RHS repeat-associated protein